MAYRGGFILHLTHMHIVAIAWIYVVLMMSITEHTVVAGIATFFLYGVFPVSIILYLMHSPERRRKRKEAEKIARELSNAKAGGDTDAAPPPP